MSGIEAMAMVDSKALIVAAVVEAKYDGRDFSALGAADKKRYVGRLDVTLQAYFAALSEARSASTRSPTTQQIEGYIALALHDIDHMRGPMREGINVFREFYKAMQAHMARSPDSEAQNG